MNLLTYFTPFVVMDLPVIKLKYLQGHIELCHANCSVKKAFFFAFSFVTGIHFESELLTFHLIFE